MSRGKALIPLMLLFSTTFNYAAPGDILFSDDFESGLANWTIVPNNGSAGIGTATSNSGASSLFTRWQNVTVTSSSIDTSSAAQIEVAVWIRRGDDSFSENPEAGENLLLQYLDSFNNWITINTFPGNGAQGEIFNFSTLLINTALHVNFQIRVQQTSGNGVDWDYWHVDDVIVTERDPNQIAGLIGEWQFDELFWNGSNAEVIDSSGNGLHLTTFNSLTGNSNPAIAGDPGTCSYGVFNGTVSFIQLDDDTSTTDSLLDIPDNLTITTWINTNVIPNSGLKSILSKDENYEFHINNNGQIFWWWSWATLTTTGPPLTIGQWHHIAVTWRSGEQVIYIDGVERARSSQTGSLIINNDPLQVGQDLDIAERFFDGLIDEVRIYETFLSASEVNTVMNETRPCTVDGVCTLTFEDNFNTAAYNNSTGSQPWSSDWLETDDNGSALTGDILITGGELRMDNSNNSGQPRIERELNLNTYLTAFLTVDFDTSNSLENNDRFDIAVSTNGGTSYTLLQTFNNDFSGTFIYDLAPYISANTRIRFRLENNYNGNNEFIEINNLVITGLRNCGPDHFSIAHDGNGINCLREAITIQAENADGSVMPDYTGTINLDLITNHGNWFTVDNNNVSSDPALGVLNDTAGDNDGAANYQFVTNDLGNVVLYLENTVAETTNISVSESGITDDNTEGDITFRPFGFVFSPSPIDTQIAGRPFNLTLTAAGQIQSPPVAECGVIEEYTGTKSINFWSTYSSTNVSGTLVDVDGSSIATNEASSAPQNVIFTNGIATVVTQYDDVGQISISAKDEIDIGDPPSGNLDEIIGGISPFVVRPFGFDIQINSDPYADDANDNVFTSAGTPFSMTLRSVLWQSSDDANNDGIPDPFVDTNSDAIPDSGGDLSNNDVTPNISQIVGVTNLTPTALVVSNSNGNLSASNFSFASFITSGLPNEGTVTFSQSWDEVGILQIDALNVDFMGGAQNVTGERINIGRFIPDHFNLNPINISDQCDSFTYAGFFDSVNAGLDKNGQTFDTSGNISARNLGNNITLNYDGAFAKLTATDIAVQAFNVTTGVNDTGRIVSNFDPLNFGSGATVYSSPLSHYQYSLLAAEFNLRADLTATDSDGVTSGVVSSNSFEVRLGRMRLTDSYGPETANLEMRIFSDYYDGTQWALNTQDSCTMYIDTNVSLDASSYVAPLADGDTSIFDPSVLTFLTDGLSSASNGLWFNAPGEGNFGSVRVLFDLNDQPWLRFDWDEDNSVDDASARLNFGYYRGSDRVIYWKEIRN